MKKVIYATLALGALILASCQKENSVNGPKVESPVFTAYIDTDAPAGQPETKTVLNGLKSEWNQDHIWILNDYQGDHGWKKEYETKATSSSTATFTESNNVGSLGEGPVVAICPTSAGKDAWWNSASPNVVNALKLNPEQSAVAGSYDPSAHIAVAYSNTKTLDFLNAVSLLKFTCGSDNISEVCVYAKGDAIVGTGIESKNFLSGNFNFNTEKKEVITESGVPANNYVKVIGTFEKGQTYYIACLPTTFTTGFTVEVVSNGIKGDNKTTNKNYELKRNTILDLGSVEYKKTLYLNTNDIWNKDGAWFAAYFFNDSKEEMWVKMEQVGDTGYYKVVAPDVTKYPKVIFCRMAADKSALAWGSKWNQTVNITIEDKNCFTITGGSGDNYSGSWSVYSE